MGCLQILSDFRDQETTLDNTIDKVLKVSYPTASLAVHTLDADLASEVVSGLMQYSFMESVVIEDELGEVLAEQHVDQFCTDKDAMDDQSFLSRRQALHPNASAHRI